MIGTAREMSDSSRDPGGIVAEPGEERRPTVITFPEGILGFAEAEAFALLRTEAPSFFWLQSLEHEELAFLLIDPFPFFEGYSVELEEADVGALEAASAGDVAVLAIVTLPSEPDEPCTANLLGPIAVNLEKGLGRQVIVRDGGYGVRAVLDLEGASTSSTTSDR